MQSREREGAGLSEETERGDDVPAFLLLESFPVPPGSPGMRGWAVEYGPWVHNQAWLCICHLRTFTSVQLGDENCFTWPRQAHQLTDWVLISSVKLKTLDLPCFTQELKKMYKWTSALIVFYVCPDKSVWMKLKDGKSWVTCLSLV